MIYTNIIKSEFESLAYLGNKLLEHSEILIELIKERIAPTELQFKMEEHENLIIEYQSHLKELHNLLSSTIYNTMSELLSKTNNPKLVENYNDIKHNTYLITLKNREIKALVDECLKITNFQLNCILGKEVEPINYQFDKKNIHKQQLSQFKKSLK